MAKSATPTFRRRWLGKTLAELRNRSGRKLQAAADTLGRSRTTVQRYETGEYPITTSQVLTLLDLYDVSDRAERTWALKLTREAAQRGWWDGFEIHNELADYLWMEENSQTIQVLATGTIPGILQTSKFAETLINEGPDRDDELLRNRRLEARLMRGETLRQNNCPTFEFLLYEPVLHNMVGTAHDMAEQLDYLLQATQEETSSLRILPAASWKHIALGVETGFTIFTLQDAWPEVLCVETPLGATYRESPEITTFQDAFKELWTMSALDDISSQERISQIRKDLIR